MNSCFASPVKKYQLSKLLRDGEGSSGCRSAQGGVPKSYCRSLLCRFSVPPTPTMLFPLKGCTFPSSLHGVQSRAACAYRSLLHGGPKASLPSCVLYHKQEKHFLTASLGMNWTDGPLGLNVCVLEMGVCVFILLTRTCFKRK